MEITEAIIGRRSIRNYDPNKPVSNDLVSNILDVARFAPSSGNLQNWKVILVSDSEVKSELATAALKQSWITNASMILVICNDFSDVKRLYKERGDLYSVQNVAAFVQNILLVSYSLGLGTCWVGAFDSEAVKRVLRIPNGVEPEAIISLGYSIEEVDTPSRKNLDSITFFETWGKNIKDFDVFPLEKHKDKVGDVQKKGKGFFTKLFSKSK